MGEEEHCAQVRDLYAALARGDLPTVVSMFADDVEFRSPVTRCSIPEVPWSRPRCSPAEVAAFFREMGTAIDVQPFEIFDILAIGDKVVVEARNKGTVRATGRLYEHEWAMIFTIRDGKISRCYHYYDSADLLPAVRGE